MKIASYTLKNQLVLAPMAGISDRPFRNLCREQGAGLAVSEMVASQPHLRTHKRTLLKGDHRGENGLRCVQILGTNPEQMAQAAVFNQQRGADIVDINMGCPAKKVCAVASGSALLKNEGLVKQILEAVVNAVEIPITLKIRTGWDLNNRNAITIAKIAEDAGIAALTIHGRTRACKFSGHAEYDTIKAVKKQLSIPVIANGDISSPEKAAFVLDYTNADAVMIGRSAQGQPWIFKQILQHFSGNAYTVPSINEIQALLLRHLSELYRFYGDGSGVRIARKHIGWYLNPLGVLPTQDKHALYQTCEPQKQLALVNAAFDFFNH